MTIRERAQAAIQRAEETPVGPWRECGADRGGCDCGMVWSEGGGILVMDRPVDLHGEGVPVPVIEDSKKIARFVAHARADVPDLGKAILRLTGPAMRDRIALAIVAGCMRGAAPNALADSIMDLLQEEPV